MRIVFTRSNPVDPDPRVQKEAACLSELGHEVTILGWDRSERAAYQTGYVPTGDGRTRIKRLHVGCSYGGGISNIAKFIRWNFALFFELFRTRKEFDAIHACDFDTVLPAILIQFLFKKRLVYDIFDFYVDTFNIPGWLKGAVRHSELWAIGRADSTILAGDDRIHQIAGAKPKAVHVILNAPESCPPTREVDPPGRILHLIYVGALLEHRFLREMLAIVSQRPGLHLTLAGWGPLLDEVVAASEQFQNISFLGKIDYGETLQRTATADLNFAIYDPRVPNHRFSNPNKVYEAMMVGRPVIVAQGMGIDALVAKEGCGFVVDYDKPEDTARLLESLEPSSPEIKTRGDRGRRAYEERYSWEIMKTRIKGIYVTMEAQAAP